MENTEKVVRLQDFKFTQKIGNVIFAYNSGKIIHLSECIRLESPRFYRDSIAIFKSNEELIYFKDKVKSWVIHETKFFPSQLYDLKSFSCISLEFVDEISNKNISVFDLDGQVIIPMLRDAKFYAFKNVILVKHYNFGELIWAIYSYEGTCFYEIKTYTKSFGDIFKIYDDFYLVFDVAYSCKNGKRLIPENSRYIKDVKSGIVFEKKINEKYFLGISNGSKNIILDCKYIYIDEYEIKENKIIVCRTQDYVEVYSQLLECCESNVLVHEKYRLKLLCKFNNSLLEKIKCDDQSLKETNEYFKKFDLSKFRYGVINYKGKIILPEIFTNIYSIFNKKYGHFLKPIKGSLCGLYFNDEEILPVDYEEIFFYKDEYIVAIKGKILKNKVDLVYPERKIVWRVYCEVYKYNGNKAVFYTSFMEDMFENETYTCKLDDFYKRIEEKIKKFFNLYNTKAFDKIIF